MFGLVKLLLIGCGVVYIMNKISKFIYPSPPPQRKTMDQLVACEYCGILTPEHLCVVKKERVFCGKDHAARYFI